MYGINKDYNTLTGTNKQKSYRGGVKVTKYTCINRLACKERGNI